MQMNHIRIELWLWLGKELKGDFESPSEMRSIREAKVEEGTTIREFLDDLAERYPIIACRVFDKEAKRLYPHIVLNYNDQVANPHIVHDQVLRDGDQITLFPMYTGG